MNELQALVKLLSAQKIKQIDIITEGESLEGRSRSLYNKIKDGTLATEEDAISYLYGDDQNGPETFRKLKYRLKQRLLNTVFFIDAQNYSRSKHEGGQVRLLKNWAASEILFQKGISGLSRDLMERQLKTALNLDATEIAISITKRMIKKYGLFHFNAKKYEKYLKLKEELLKKLIIEDKLERFYADLGRRLTASKAANFDEGVALIEQELMQLSSEIDQYDSFVIRLNYYNCIYFIHMIKQEFDKMDKIADVALDYFDRRPDFPGIGRFAFTQKKALGLTRLRKFDEAIVFLDKCIDLNPSPGGPSWQFIYSYKYLIHIIQRNYHSAYQDLVQVINHKAFKKVSTVFKEQWRIKEAYMHFLIQAGRVDVSREPEKLKTFSIGKFLNEVSSPSKDKKGFNISINLIQLLFLLLREKNDQVLDKLESLKQYSHRYLKGPESIRARTMIKLFLKLKDYDGNISTLLKKSKIHRTKLRENPLDFSEQSLQRETIPYEQLWEELLFALEST